MAGLRDVNVGVMRFNGDEGGSVIAPSRTSRRPGIVTAIVNALSATGRTPLSETLFEAAQVFRGADVDYGSRGSVRSVAESRVGNTHRFDPCTARPSPNPAARTSSSC